MKKTPSQTKANFLFPLLVNAFFGCSASDFQAEKINGEAMYFSGYVYDGVIGNRIMSYDISMSFSDKVINGSVDENGRYFIGPLQAKNDYSIFIVSEGYRAFESHNQHWNEMTENTLHYDAYLFPTGLEAPAQKIFVDLEGSDLPASGNVRLRPVSASSLVDSSNETPAAVSGQLWHNDADYQLRTLMFEFSDGEINIDPGVLVYGVGYAMTIFNVDGYQVHESYLGSGTTGTRSIQLNRLVDSSVNVVFVSTEIRQISESGAVAFVFNQPIKADPLSSTTSVTVEQVYSFDDDDDGERNTPYPANLTYVDVQITDYTLTIEWDKNASLETIDPDDRILSIMYGNLDSVRVMPKDSELSADVVSLGSLMSDTWFVATDKQP
jgi:hypothetical protein